MSRIDSIRADIAYVAAALESLHAEIGDNDPTDDQARAWTEGTEFVAERREALERENTRIEQVNAARAAAQIPGAVDSGNSLTVIKRTGDPFDVSDISRFSPVSDLRARAVTAIEQCDGASDDSREAAMETLARFEDKQGSIAMRYLLTGSEAYRSAWAKMLSGRSYALTADESVAMERAASLTDAAGGYAVPFLLDPTVILTNDGTNNPFRGISRIVRGTSDTWNGVSSAGVTASWDGEAAQVSDDAPTLAQPSIPAYKAQAFVPFSIEIEQDWAQLQSETGMMLNDAKDRLEGAAFATGSGSSQPTGIVTALVAGSRTTASSTSNAFVLADVYAVAEAIGPRFRRNASWVMSYPLLNDIRGFATANNYHGFTVDLTAAGVSQILGKPVYESSDMDSTYGSSENYAVVFGDFANYVIFDRVGMSVELVPHLFATQDNRPSGQRGFYAHWRVGADSVNDSAFTVLNIT